MFKRFMQMVEDENDQWIEWGVIWLNVNLIEKIEGFKAEENKNISIIRMHGYPSLDDGRSDNNAIYFVDGSAEEIVNSIYNSKWRWSGNGR